jgi:hypothetical protein
VNSVPPVSGSGTGSGVVASSATGTPGGARPWKVKKLLPLPSVTMSPSRNWSSSPCSPSPPSSPREQENRPAASTAVGVAAGSAWRTTATAPASSATIVSQ